MLSRHLQEVHGRDPEELARAPVFFDFGVEDG